MSNGNESENVPPTSNILSMIENISGPLTSVPSVLLEGWPLLPEIPDSGQIEDKESTPESPSGGNGGNSSSDSDCPASLHEVSQEGLPPS